MAVWPDINSWTNFTGQRGPGVAKNVRVERTVRDKLMLTSAGFASMFSRPLNAIFFLGPVFSFNLEVAGFYSVVFIKTRQAKSLMLLNQRGYAKDFAGNGLPTVLLSTTGETGILLCNTLAYFARSLALKW